MQKSMIFTEAFNCGKILKIALDSFHKHHDLIVYVFGTNDDFEELGSVANHPNNILIDCTGDAHLKNLYNKGHEGTAYIFAKVLNSVEFSPLNQVIHFDSDVVFKKESVSLIEEKFDEGYDIVGSRRCYKNNPANIPVDPSLPDTISTYFFGIRKTSVPKYDFEYFRKMCKGSVNPLGHDVFDFFDPVTFVVLKTGGRICFLEPYKIGGQNELGNKINGYESNKHLDMGSHLAHFGGVGSGYSYFKYKAEQNRSYGDWALGRYSLFVKMFYGEDIECLSPTQYDIIGRWINGNYDQEIYSIITIELNA